MRASYSAGLLNLLLTEGIYLDWVGGISAGTTLMSNYLTRSPERVRHAFTDFVMDKDFAGWRHFARGRGLFNAEYIYQRSGLPGGPIPFAWDTFAANPAELAIGGFNATTGETIYWGRADATTLDDLMIRVRASSTMPILMPLVTIDGQVYADGALGHSGGIPLEAAQAAGYSRFLVVLTQERSYVKVPDGNERVLRRYFRNLPTIPNAIHERPARYNAVREEIFALEAAGQAHVFMPEHMTVNTGERSLDKLNASYAAGLAQARRELPAIKDFLGL